MKTNWCTLYLAKDIDEQFRYKFSW